LVGWTGADRADLEFGAIVAPSATLAPNSVGWTEADRIAREFGAIVAPSATLAPNFGVGMGVSGRW
jgi:hypothetical protein